MLDTWLRGERHSVPGPDVSVFQGGRLGSAIPWVLTAAGVGRALSTARLWGGCHRYSQPQMRVPPRGSEHRKESITRRGGGRQKATVVLTAQASGFVF